MKDKIVKFLFDIFFFIALAVSLFAEFSELTSPTKVGFYVILILFWITLLILQSHKSKKEKSGQILVSLALIILFAGFLILPQIYTTFAATAVIVALPFFVAWAIYKTYKIYSSYFQTEVVNLPQISDKPKKRVIFR